MIKALAIVAVATLTACTGGYARVKQPEPVIRTVEVSVPTPVPCKALTDLGPAPKYDDTDAAIAAAPDIFSLAKLYAAGRLQRIKRTTVLELARETCAF